MPWCPKCRCEYRSGFSVCADCSVPLVEELTAAQAQPQMLGQIPLDDPAMVFLANDELQLALVQGLLEAHEIAFAAKDFYSVGSYLRTAMGRSVYGWALFVSAQDVESAHALIAAYLQENPEEQPGIFPEDLDTGTGAASAVEHQQAAEEASFDLAWEEEEEPAAAESPVGQSFDRRRRIMRNVILFVFVLPTVLSLLLLPMRACGAFLPNFF